MNTGWWILRFNIMLINVLTGDWLTISNFSKVYWILAKVFWVEDDHPELPLAQQHCNQAQGLVWQHLPEERQGSLLQSFRGWWVKSLWRADSLSCDGIKFRLAVLCICLLLAFIFLKTLPLRLPLWLVGKESACNAGDPGSIPAWGRSPGEGNGNPL